MWNFRIIAIAVVLTLLGTIAIRAWACMYATTVRAGGCVTAGFHFPTLPTQPAFDMVGRQSGRNGVLGILGRNGRV